MSYLTKIRRAKYSKRAKEMKPMLTKIQMIRGQISSEVGIVWVVNLFMLIMMLWFRMKDEVVML